MLKNYNKIFTILILVISFGVCDVYTLYSQPIIPEFANKNKDTTKKQLFDFRLSADISNASMRYDKDGNNILRDTAYYFIDSLEETQDYYEYLTDFSQQKYNLHIGYLGVKNLYCYAKLPLAFTSVLERVTVENQRYDRNKDSKPYFEGVQFDAGYSFNLDFVNLDFLNVTFGGSVFFPFHAYSASELIDEFHSKKIEYGRTLETSFVMKMDWVLKTTRLQIGVIEQFRKDFADRTQLNFLIGTSNIENTELYANLKYVKSNGDYQEKYRVDFWRPTLWENYLDMDLGFTIFFTDEIYSNVGYTIRLWGENTFSRNLVNINLGYIFSK